MEEQKNKKKRIGRIIGVVCGVIAFFLVKQFVFAPESFYEAMQHAVDELNKSCPMMVDEQTRLDNAEALSDDVFQYNYTIVSLVKDSVNIKAFEDGMKPIILNDVKTKPALKIYRDNKVTMTYLYKDKNGVFITKIAISPDLYSDSK
ncbi:hypothetical protein EMN47_13550 [Prolixibacteraceae bacterium JC049]|nr:hypothetical protein [Prolixibacteraceae bacterium JC049]